MKRLMLTVTPLEDVVILEPRVHWDDRGYFVETYNEKDLRELGLEPAFVQDNESLSVKGVLRGLHYQKEYPQAKLVRAAQGCIFDVVVDIRPGSETFGQWFGVELSSENKRQLYIPEGYAHGFLTLSPTALVCYKVTDFYHPGDESGILWCDASIGIEWPSVAVSGQGEQTEYAMEDGTKLIISPKDQCWPPLDLLMGANL